MLFPAKRTNPVLASGLKFLSLGDQCYKMHPPQASLAIPWCILYINIMSINPVSPILTGDK